MSQHGAQVRETKAAGDVLATKKEDDGGRVDKDEHADGKIDKVERESGHFGRELGAVKLAIGKGLKSAHELAVDDLGKIVD